MKRKTTVLLAGTLTVSMLLGVAATANADSIGAFAAQAVHTVQTLAAPRSTAPTGTWFTVDGEPLDGFDPAKGADDPGTDYTDAETYTVDGKVEIHDVPAGWTVDCGMMVHDLTGKMSAYYLLKNGGAEYRWWFDGATDIVHTTDELRGLRLTVNGVEQPDDCSKDVTIHGLRGSDVTGFTGWPGQAWTFSVGDYQNGEGRRYVFKPKNADTPQVTYTFMFDAPKPSNELGVVVARLDDGSLVTGFDGTKGVSYDIPEGHRVTLENVPDGWEETANATVTGGAQRITLSSTLDEVTYSFTPVPESSYAWTYDINMLKDLKITTRDGRQIEGFDWHGGQFTIPYDYGMLVYTGYPDDWTVSSTSEETGTRLTITSPDGKVKAEYLFTLETPPASLDDLANVKAYADGQPIDSFTPKADGTWTVPNGSEITLEGLPSDNWVTVHEDGTLTWKMVSADGSLSVTWTFQYGTQSTSELAGVTATYGDDNTPVASFDPVNGGLFNIPEGASVTLNNIPAGWTTTKLTDGRLGWTLTSDDGSLSVTYVFAPPAAKTHKVTFLMNGGTGEDITEYVQDGKKVAKPADPTKPGARFIGWMLDGNPYDFAQPVTKDLTLTAGWVTTHTVTYDYGHDGLTDTVTIDDGDVLEKPADPEWEGHTFTGWKMESGSMFDSFGQPIRNDMTLIAQWTTASGEQFTVTFLDPEGGTSTPAQQVTDGDRLKEPTKPVRDGYEFTGWLREDGKPYDFTQPVHAGFTLTAGWQPIQYNVVFSVNGGDHTIPTQKVGWQGKATEPAQPTREGYTFTGWYTDEACQNRYDFGTTVTHNLTLFAGWEKITPTPVTHTVTFDSDGGTTYPAQTVDDGEQAMFPGTPVKDGYTFVQWFLGGQPYDFGQPVTGDITLTAHWKKDETPAPVTHTVTFDTMGGSAVDAQTVDDGGKAVKPADPTRDGYEFTGWLLDGQPYDFNQPVTGDITLNAGWNATPAMHTVTIDPANGEAVTSYKVQDGARITQPATPVRDGYTFQGWTLGGQPYDFTQPVTGDITIVAQWEKDETPAPVTHTVTFDSNGGSAVDAQTVDDGGKAVKPADPTRDGYTFAGWMLDGQPYDFGQPVTGDITLTAEWTRNAVIDELKGVRALIDGKELDGFDPTRDGEYTIPAGSIVQLVDVPDGWEIVSRPGATTVTFTITNGDRNVSYTFTYGSSPEDPDTPDDPDNPDDPSQPDNPGQTDDPDTPDSPGTDDKPNTGGEIHITGGGQQSNPNTVTDDVHVMAEDAENLGATGAGILPAVAATAGAAVLAAALAIILHVRRKKAADADPAADHEA